MRAFIAVELPEAVRERLAILGKQLRMPGLRASWPPPQNLHLTLRFLGDVREDDLVHAGDVLNAACADVTPFPVTVAGLGAFPSMRRPSVIWVGVSPSEGGIEALHAAAEQSAQAIGIPPESKRFHPHITIARIKDSRTGAALRPRVEAIQDVTAGEFTVQDVSLCTSRLTPHGAVYTQVRRIALG